MDRTENPARQPVDEDAATELLLYADNESSLYPQKKSILANLLKRKRNGSYDPALAPKLWTIWLTSAAKAYAKDFGGDWATTFSVATREHAAREIAERESRAMDGGEYDEAELRRGNPTEGRTEFIVFDRDTDERVAGPVDTASHARAERDDLIAAGDTRHLLVKEIRYRRGNPSEVRHGNPGPTLRDAQAELRAIGITLVKNDGEYRVYMHGDRNPDTGYFTNDLKDAVETGRIMSKRRHHNPAFGELPQPTQAQRDRFGMRHVIDDRHNREHVPRGYIIMRDSFMSGWGGAEGGKSYYVLAVDTENEGYIVIANAKDRSEMKNVHYSSSRPRIGPNDHMNIADRHVAPRWYQPGAFEEK